MSKCLQMLRVGHQGKKAKRLTVSAACIVVPSMPTSPSFCPFLFGCSTKARGLTFFARMCALHE